VLVGVCVIVFDAVRDGVWVIVLVGVCVIVLDAVCVAVCVMV